ncbi:ROK family protein [Pararhizobium polonicum]|uniref:ROK family protein n=1 Tax=Pararhizobium polonicum TaxID=1612624 RepID=A0A1C7P3G4_9HYPH|nr:ROK family protein [Pararhizobium polonicum]OBZ95813.1 ROK family protein [Pararhizobium polonicum]
MTAKKNAAAATSKPVVLSIDVGGSHVKILSSAPGATELKADSGPSMTALQMVDAVKGLAAGLSYDVISIGYPGPVKGNAPLRDPVNLGPGWAGHDFAASFGKPVKLVNDALMQAIGSYDGGRMLFLGLGTGLGAAIILENVAQPLEIAHLPYKKRRSFEDYVGEHALEARGKKKWKSAVFDVVDKLNAAILPDYIVIGGGNVEKLDDLPENCRRGDNLHAFDGGFRLWHDARIVV